MSNTTNKSGISGSKTKQRKARVIPLHSRGVAAHQNRPEIRVITDEFECRIEVDTPDISMLYLRDWLHDRGIEEDRCLRVSCQGKHLAYFYVFKP